MAEAAGIQEKKNQQSKPATNRKVQILLVIGGADHKTPTTHIFLCTMRYHPASTLCLYWLPMN